jgi:hypothetical protein
VQYQQTLSELQDLDYAKAITDLTRKQADLEAAQQSFFAFHNFPCSTTYDAVPDLACQTLSRVAFAGSAVALLAGTLPAPSTIPGRQASAAISRHRDRSFPIPR